MRTSESPGGGSDVDTIVAAATPTGRGGVSILRLSGSLAGDICRRLTGRLPSPREARLCRFLDSDQQELDRGLTLYFPAPSSFTGEDVVELHCHGSPVVVELMTRRCVSLGARIARPGEFSERAFLNDRMDLAQAEAVADLIEASTEAAAKSAVNSLRGEFSRRIESLVTQVTNLRIYVEAAIDFPDEEVDFLSDDSVKQRIQEIDLEFSGIESASRRGKILREGYRVVLAGMPNAGKSSLLNRLSREDRAIVSDIPGTTRDTVEQLIDLDGLPVLLTDTAGIRESCDTVEEEGVRRARSAIDEADLIVHVIDGSNPQMNLLPEFGSRRAISVVNKIDLDKSLALSDESEYIGVSALTGEGLECLIGAIKRCADFHHGDTSYVISRQRHVQAIEKAREHFNEGVEQLSEWQAGELFAEELSACQSCLGEITGQITSDDLLGLIFGSFCIGK
ncbi:MAG: tRNA uridine-5-carboxymethylaminomethyl(34) synthesis GTPase MnmE [Pseudomonadota bacterium]